MLTTEPGRVVVTGLGVLSPIGIGVKQFWQAALDGVVGTAEITRFDVSGYPSRLGGEVKDFDPASFGLGVPAAALERSTQFALAVSRAAVADSGVDTAGSTRTGVCFGTVLGNRAGLEPDVHSFHRGGRAPAWRRAAPMSELADAVASELGSLGPSLVVGTACASGNTAISYAADTILAGRADVMVVGGTDEMSTAMVMMFASLRSLATDAVRPFDRHRAGLLASEGAAALVLESYEHARRRGANIHAELVGWASYSDAYHITAPHPDGLGAERSMRRVLAQGKVPVDRLGYISAHGTGTPANDVIEARAIRRVLGGETTAVSSLKGALGHMQGAASAIEAVACVLAVRDDVVPPTANLIEQDPECDIDVVAGAAREGRVGVALNNAFGFGGNTSCTAFARLGRERVR